MSHMVHCPFRYAQQSLYTFPGTDIFRQRYEGIRPPDGRDKICPIGFHTKRKVLVEEGASIDHPPIPSTS